MPCLSRHTSTWQVQAAGVHRRGRAVPRSKQPRRCQAARRRAGRRAGALTRGVFRTPEGECVSRFEFEGFAFTWITHIVDTTFWSLGAPEPPRALVAERPSTTAAGALT
jgi:hypothetical protein